MKSKILALPAAVLTFAGIAMPAAAQDAVAGASLFKQRCMMCHSTEAGKRPGMGPNMAGLAGRKAASTEFKYSTALKNSKLVWNSATLDTFLTAPGKLVPGTQMVIAVTDAKQRADIVAYLGTLTK